MDELRISRQNETDILNPEIAKKRQAEIAAAAADRASQIEAGLSEDEFEQIDSDVINEAVETLRQDQIEHQWRVLAGAAIKEIERDQEEDRWLKRLNEHTGEPEGVAASDGRTFGY
ncbi:hypothetical protein B7Y94_00110 [Candidatus Saccharibacteria bacterium 32-49-12]|nr:MAG: hypothetical protein B7Y94_00110 [Candidatus Saccharibacteria bacterium 32-49-12]